MTPAFDTSQQVRFHDYWLDGAFDEMFQSESVPRPHYRALHEMLQDLPLAEMRRRKQAADVSFLHQGITFTVYGREEGTERIFPHDLLPRIITSAEWETIERGLTQRITALNLFLRDIYGDGRCLADGVVPREIVYSCKHFRREMRGIDGSQEHLRRRGRHRPDPPARRPLRRARRQPARAERRVLHADVAPGDEAHLPGTVPHRRRALHRSLQRSRCWPRCARSRPKAGPIPTSSCSLPASTTPPTSSTPSSRARWASSWWKAATSRSTTTWSTCAPPPGCAAWM